MVAELFSQELLGLGVLEVAVLVLLPLEMGLLVRSIPEAEAVELDQIHQVAGQAAQAVQVSSSSE